MNPTFQKIEKIFFYLLIFSIPFETRLILHSWTLPFSEWTAAFLYGTDILILALFVLWLIRGLNNTSRGFIRGVFFRKDGFNSSFFLVLFFIISALSIFNSRIVGLSVYQLLKLAEFIIFFFYIKTNAGELFDFRNILKVIIISGAFQAIIAILQYAKQGSLGLKIFGESPISPDVTGVAVFFADGEKYMRAYGTTPHPNVLAAWLFVAIFAFYNYYLYSNSKNFGKKNIFFLIAYAVTLVAFFLTFSRTVIAFWILGSGIRLVMVMFRNKFFDSPEFILQRTKIILLVSSVVIVLFLISFWPQVKARALISYEEEAVTQRIFYNDIARKMTEGAPMLGIGIGQFVPNLMSELRFYPKNIYQPVHNIYLLLSSETGIGGLAAFILFLFFIFWDFLKRTRLAKGRYLSFFVFSLSFLAMGLFDHLFLTLQQGSLIFWMAMALLTVDM